MRGPGSALSPWPATPPRSPTPPSSPGNNDDNDYDGDNDYDDRLQGPEHRQHQQGRDGAAVELRGPEVGDDEYQGESKKNQPSIISFGIPP